MTYAAEVLADSPFLYWPLDESSGTNANDSSPNNRDGTATASGLLGAATFLDGTFAADLTGSSHIASAVNWSGAGVATGSVEAWVYTTTAASNWTILGSNDGAGNYDKGLEITSGGKARCYIYDGSAKFATTASNLPLSQWVHLVGTWDGTNVRIYMNGVLEGTTAAGNANTANRPFCVGRTFSGITGFPGNVAHAACYDGVLTHPRIAVHYANGASLGFFAEVLADAPLAYWKLSDASGTSALDASGNARTGTYAGSPTLGVTAPTPDVPGSIATDGSNDKMTSPSLTLGTAAPLTIELWVNNSATLDSATASKPLMASSSATVSSIDFGASSALFASEVVSVSGFSTGTDDITYWTGITIPAGWHHHVFTFSGVQGGWTYYLDGVDTTTVGATLNQHSGGAGGWPTDSIKLAQGASVYAAYAGLASMAVYGSALSAVRVAAHYAAMGTVSLEGSATGAATATAVAVRVADWMFGRAQGSATASGVIRPQGSRRRTVIADVDGVPYGELANAKHGDITWELNRWTDSKVSIPLSDPAAALVTEERIREAHLWRGDQFLTAGPMARPSADKHNLAVTVHDPLWYLTRRHLGAADRTNYVINGDFEDGLTGWTPCVDPVQTFHATAGAQYVPPLAQIVRFPKLTGERSLKAQNYVEGTANTIQQIFRWTVDDDASPDGDLWTMSGYIYVETFTAPAYNYEAVRFVRFSTTELWDDPDIQAAVPGAKKPLQTSSFQVNEDTPTGEWIPFTIEFVTPPKAGEPEDLQIALIPPVGVVYFDRIRVTREEKTVWRGIDQRTIIGDLVTAAQDPTIGKSDVNLDTVGPLTGVLRDLTLVHHDHPNIWDEIHAFTELENGVDISAQIGPTSRSVQVHYPQRGRHIPELELRLGRNVADFAWTFDGDSAANSVICLGTADGSAREEGFAINPDSFAGGLTLEEVFTAPQGTRIERLDELAAEHLTMSAEPEVLAVTTVAHSDTNRARNFIGRINPGDTLPVNISIGAAGTNVWTPTLEIVGVYRITRMTLTPADNFELVLTRRSLR